MLAEAAKRFCDDGINSPVDVNERCVAWNLLHDHRISNSRSKNWEETVASPLQRSLEAAFRVYSDRVADTPAATYLDGRINGSNLLRSAARDVPSGGEHLVHVLDLTNRTARSIWQFGKDSGIPGLSGMDLANAQSLALSLTRQLEGKPVSQQLPLMRAFFLSHEIYVHSHEPHPPVWVAVWRKWRLALTGEQSECRADAVGLSKPRSYCWLATLKYPASRAGQLIRPTQLEAGWFGRHFPSPSVCSPGSGGRIVHGLASTSPPKGDCLWEYLHKPIIWSELDWLSAGEPVSCTLRPVGPVDSLLSDRSIHWQRLCDEFDKEAVRSWMERANG